MDSREGLSAKLSAKIHWNAIAHPSHTYILYLRDVLPSPSRSWFRACPFRAGSLAVSAASLALKASCCASRVHFPLSACKKKKKMSKLKVYWEKSWKSRNYICKSENWGVAALRQMHIHPKKNRIMKKIKSYTFSVATPCRAIDFPSLWFSGQAGWLFKWLSTGRGVQNAGGA